MLSGDGDLREKYYHWLYHIEGIGSTSLKKIIKIADPKQIFQEGTGCLKGILPEKKCEKIESKRQKGLPEHLWEQLQKEKISLSYYGGQTYPKKLLNIPDPPLILYQKGRNNLWKKPSVAVVGARNCSLYGKQMAQGLGKELAQNGITVISGMARGIDGISQWAALEEGGESVAVLGSGVQICYPPENRGLYFRLQEEGALLSESLPYTAPAAGLFPRRNRLISGLADILVVVEAREKSGTLITVDMALEQGKEVYCIPGRVTDDLSKGCNSLIKMGAGMIFSIEQFVEEICPQLKVQYQGEKERHKQGLSEQEQQVVSVMETTPLFVEEIFHRIQEKTRGLSFRELMEVLMDLQLRGKVAQQGQSYYLL